MRVFLLSFLFLLSGLAHAEKIVPSGMSCLKEAKGLGLSVVDAYQTCSMKPRIRSCVFKQLNENKALIQDKKELKKLGKVAVKECQE